MPACFDEASFLCAVVYRAKRNGESMKNQSGILAKKKPAFLLAIAAVIAVAVAVYVGARPGKEAVVKPPEEIEDYLFWQANELTDLKLAGANGKTLGLADLKGKWSFIFFGYTQCPDVCPLTMGILGKTFMLLEKDPVVSQEIQGVFISVDPQRDTPELLKEYVSYFNNKFIGVTGDTAQLDAVSRQMSALYTIHPKETEKPGEAKGQQKPGDVSSKNAYAVTHSSTVFLIDPQGRLYGRFPPPHLPQEIAEVFLKIRTFYNKGVKK